jgi:hypothetical protein
MAPSSSDQATHGHLVFQYASATSDCRPKLTSSHSPRGPTFAWEARIRSRMAVPAHQVAGGYGPVELQNLPCPVRDWRGVWIPHGTDAGH